VALGEGSPTFGLDVHPSARCVRPRLIGFRHGRSNRQRWEVFADERLRRPVKHGTTLAHAGNAHAVHVEVDGLHPDRWYWYRFTTDGRHSHESPVGRTRTFPHPLALAGSMRFGLAGCQHYETGYFTAYRLPPTAYRLPPTTYRHMAADDVDVVFHYGDYIYEYGPGQSSVCGLCHLHVPVASLRLRF
jgi:phosphodiesterase/alkaline phosphatase D-like protein